MARRKNTKFIDPRYFMDEKTEVLNEATDPSDQPAGGADSLAQKKAKCKGKWMEHGMKGFDGSRGWHGYCEEKKIDEGGCGDHEPHGIEMVAIGDEEAPMEDEEDSPEGLANELLAVAQRIADMLGQESSVTSLPDEEIPMMEANRSAKGNVTQAAREKHATVGKDKFPIFDKKSAEAAIDLRGHAPKADRAKIINKAAKYAPEAAKKAREADKK